MSTICKKQYWFKYILVITALSLISIGCADKTSSEKTAISINSYSITAGEFNNLFNTLSAAEDTLDARKAFLDNLIIRKLLLQEAQRQGLDRQKDFLRSVESFWEQSLLKVVVDKKMEEISKDITITDRAIKDYYIKWTQENPDEEKSFNEMREPIRIQLLRIKQAAILNSWTQKLKSEADINIDKKAIGTE